MQRSARATLDMLGLEIAPDTRVYKLSVAQQQMIELAKMLHTRASLLIMDEPTSTLSQPEVSTLFSSIRRIKAHGVGVIYVSHRLDEVMSIADRATILRYGRRVVTIDIASVDMVEHLMSGLAACANFPHPTFWKRSASWRKLDAPTCFWQCIP